MILIGEAAGDYFGHSVSSAGDVNGDGFHDVIVGAERNDAGGYLAGRAYLFFGGIGLSGQYNASDADIILTGEAASDYFGTSVSSAGVPLSLVT